MKSFARYVLAAWLALAAAIGQAAVEQTGKLAPEPTVSVVWVVLFLALFVGVCVVIGVAAVRAERKSKASADK